MSPDMQAGRPAHQLNHSDTRSRCLHGGTGASDYELSIDPWTVGRSRTRPGEQRAMQPSSWPVNCAPPCESCELCLGEAPHPHSCPCPCMSVLWKAQAGALASDDGVLPQATSAAV